jgi:hypothetical protein
MENNSDNFLKNKLSIDEMELETPGLSLVQEAREKILARKKEAETKTSLLTGWRAQFGFLFNPFPVGVTAILIIGGIFYFTNNETQKTELAIHPENAANNYSISSSSTVLASLTQYTNNKTATASSTVLSSIMTFVVKN